MENLSLERQFFYKDKLLHDLEERSWCYLPQFFSQSLVSDLRKILYETQDFHQAKIGGGLEIELNKGIRDSQISWIEDWKEESLSFLDQEFFYLQNLLRDHFLLSLKRYESQFAIYPRGGFYKKHLDQIAGKGHRQVTIVLFLNDVNAGGELVLYNKNNMNEEDKRIAPKEGGAVIFFSSHIFHEVLPTQEERLSLTTWIRDDEEEPWAPSANF